MSCNQGYQYSMEEYLKMKQVDYQLLFLKVHKFLGRRSNLSTYNTLLLHKQFCNQYWRTGASNVAVSSSRKSYSDVSYPGKGGIQTFIETSNLKESYPLSFNTPSPTVIESKPCEHLGYCSAENHSVTQTHQVLWASSTKEINRLSTESHPI